MSFRSNTFPPPCPHEADGLEEFRAPGQVPTALPLPESCFAIQYVYRLIKNICQLLTGLLLANLEKIGWGVCGVGDPFSMRIETIRKGDKLRTYILSDLLLINKRVLSENRRSRQVYDLQCLLTCLTPFRDILSFLIESRANSGLGRSDGIVACEFSLVTIHSRSSHGILRLELSTLGLRLESFVWNPGIKISRP